MTNRTMKRQIITILLALVAINGQAQENNYTVRGKVDNPDIKAVFLSRAGGGYDNLNSAQVSDSGEFVFTGHVAEPIPVYLITKDRVGLDYFILEPGDITLHGMTKAVGSALNDSLAHLIDYSSSLFGSMDGDAARKQFYQYAEAMFLRHKNDALGIRILESCTDTPSDKLRLYNMAGPMIKDFPNFVNAKDTWAKYDTTKEGEMMLDIQSATDGRKLSDYVGKGKYALVDFCVCKKSPMSSPPTTSTAATSFRCSVWSAGTIRKMPSKPSNGSTSRTRSSSASRWSRPALTASTASLTSSSLPQTAGY